MTSKLLDYKEQYEELQYKKNLTGDDALKAVQNDCSSLQFVKKQTEAICLEAIKQNPEALKYVNSKFFK